MNIYVIIVPPYSWHSRTGSFSFHLTRKSNSKSHIYMLSNSIFKIILKYFAFQIIHTFLLTIVRKKEEEKTAMWFSYCFLFFYSPQYIVFFFSNALQQVIGQIVIMLMGNNLPCQHDVDDNGIHLQKWIYRCECAMSAFFVFYLNNECVHRIIYYVHMYTISVFCLFQHTGILVYRIFCTIPILPIRIKCFLFMFHSDDMMVAIDCF